MFIYRKWSRLSVLSFLILLMVALALGACGRNQSKPTTFKVNGEAVKTPETEVKEGELYVPASFLKEQLGMEVTWTPVPVDAEAKGPKVYYSNRVQTLMYHDISPKDQPGRSSITVADFRKQLELLRSEGFHVISMDQYVDFLLNNGKVPDNAVLLTFDDGYETFYTYAYPMLKEFGYPATVFLIVSGVDDPSRPGSPKLKWDQVKEMNRDGMSFYSHTYDQHITIPVDEKDSQKPALMHAQYLKKEKRMETQEEYRTRIHNDLAKANERLNAELGNKRNILCFPYGKYSLTTLDVAKSLGIEVMFTTMEGIDTRVDRIGYRMNGSKAGEKPEVLISRMKKGAETLENAETKGVLNVNGNPLPLSGRVPETKGKELLVPLREFCTAAKVGIAHEKKQNLIELTVSQ